ncbi:O-antigen ligase family protein [Spectribacter hydrogenooxidans]|uniref:O-antigen ligase family protein n=1 Tax=Spectribacter hydrogenoxidans TaxID=3075608 RepID=A0ABU3C469_9GAMM|nr:O-antigen ligase family protein [Salinisphaera sp. W335]MDT0636363.1 O-antigen ligase family protein [Salinisphaera sp. W335]
MMTARDFGLLPRDVLLAFFLFSGFLKAAQLLSGPGDLTVVGFVIVAALVAFGLVVRPIYLSRSSRHFITGFAVFSIVALLGYLVGEGGDDARKKFLQLVFVGGLGVFAAPVLITSTSRLRGFFLLTISLGVLCGAVVLLGNDPDVKRDVLGGGEGSYQWLSRMSCYAATTALGLAFASGSKMGRLVLLTCAAVSGVSLFTGGARQALVAITVVIAYLGFMSPATVRSKRSGQRWRVFLLIGFVAVAVAFLLGRFDLLESSGVNRFVDFSTQVATFNIGQLAELSDRPEIYADAARIFAEHPVIGSGWGAFQFHAETTQYRHAHNVFLELLSELGLVGLVAFLAMLVPVVRIVASRTRIRSAGPLATTCAALVLAQLTMMQFSGDLGTNRLFFFFCMLLLVAMRVEKQEPTSRRKRYALGSESM